MRHLEGKRSFFQGAADDGSLHNISMLWYEHQSEVPCSEGSGGLKDPMIAVPEQRYFSAWLLGTSRAHL